MIKNFLNSKGHQNPISGSKVMAILLKGWVLPIGGASAGEGLPCSLRSRLYRTLCLYICGGVNILLDRDTEKKEALLTFLRGQDAQALHCKPWFFRMSAGTK